MSDFYKFNIIKLCVGSALIILLVIVLGIFSTKVEYNEYKPEQGYCEHRFKCSECGLEI